MILNIIDRREKPYRWRCINAIVEAAWHDNSVPDSDQARVTYEEPAYDELNGISLTEAVQWASALPVEVTLYLYDPGRPVAEPA